MKEATLIKKFKTFVLTLDSNVFFTKIHQSAFSQKGFPDIVMVSNGTTFFLEAKANPRSNPTALQKMCLKQIESAGGNAGILKIGKDSSFIIESLDGQILNITMGKTTIEDIKKFFDGKETKDAV